VLLDRMVSGGMGGSGNGAVTPMLSRNPGPKPSHSSSMSASIPLERCGHFRLGQEGCGNVGFAEGGDSCGESVCEEWNALQMNSGTDGSEEI
jgi:hypothetical protein